MLQLEKFNVRVVFRGEGYGLNDSLINDKDVALVEFYDNRHGTDRGQFVSRYYASTLLENDNRGLILDGGVPAWTVPVNDMALVREYLRSVV
jgi:hypothetical protein